MMYAGIQTGIALSILIPVVVSLTFFYMHAVNNGPQNRVAPAAPYTYKAASTVGSEPAGSPHRDETIPLRSGPHQRGDTDSGVSGKGDSQLSSSDVDTTFSSEGIKGVKEPQHMDGAYYTGEPLPDKPDVQFAEKPLDLEEAEQHQSAAAGAGVRI